MLFLSVWTFRYKSEQPLSLSDLKKISWAPAASDTESGESLSQPPKMVLSGDVENADFPDVVGFRGNVALIMEEDPSAVPNFVPVVTHFRNMLDPSWEMVILTRRGWKIPPGRAFREFLSSGAIKIRFLPPESDSFPSHAAVSIFLTSPWLWQTFQNVNRLLMFQPDSILCSKADTRVDDFLEWDFIGAPIEEYWVDTRKGFGTHEAHPDAQAFNGGLCIRNPRLFLDIALRYNFTDDLYSIPNEEDLPNFLRFEDQWFTRKIEDTPELLSEVKLPPPEIAGAFAVETWYWDKPLGYHQPHRWLPNRYEEIVQWCPEVGMIFNQEGPDTRWWGKQEQAK